MYVHLPLLAYLTDFQILPSVYDAVKKKHGYSDEDVDANEGTECDAGSSYIYAATIDKLLLHILGITLLHDINNTRRKFYQRYMPYVIVNVGTHKGNEYDAGAYDYVTGFTWAFGRSMDYPRKITTVPFFAAHR